MLSLLRMLAVLALVSGLAPRMAAMPEPGLAMAMAAGALCLGGDADGMPSTHAHEHCALCLGASPGLAAGSGPKVPVPVRQGDTSRRGVAASWGGGGSAAYAPRGPPGATG